LLQVVLVVVKMTQVFIVADRAVLVVCVAL
jgi:hypothetical protein